MKCLKHRIKLPPASRNLEIAIPVVQASNDTCRPANELKLKFRQARLGSVLTYLREAAGCIIHVRSNTLSDRTVNLWQDQPVDTTDALVLLKQVLTEEGCAVFQTGRRLNIISDQDLKKNRIPLPVL